MGRLVGILRSDEHETHLAPQSGIADIDALVEQVRAAGLPVDVVDAQKDFEVVGVRASLAG